MEEEIRPELRVEAPEIRVDSWNDRELDPEWTYIDQAGHGHFRSRLSVGLSYPTLKSIMVPDIDEGGEDIEVFDHYECPHCEEVIEPSMRYTGGVARIPGAKRYFINNVEVEREAFLAVWREEAIRIVLEKAEDI